MLIYIIYTPIFKNSQSLQKTVYKGNLFKKNRFFKTNF
jgi:hypothetical protein